MSWVEGEGEGEGEGVVARSCPGMYCGRTRLAGLVEEWGECGACPRGSRANATSYCVPCAAPPALYDLQYLGFMALLPLLLHFFFVDMFTLGRSKKEIISHHLCALAEVTVAAVAALLASSPAGALELRVCTPQALSDWYTLLHNPQPGYTDTLHCTQEAVYPLYSLVLLMYMCSLLMTVLLRPWLVRAWSPTPGGKAIYSALYFYPILVLIHTVAAGLIYSSFPYIIIIISMMSSASHFSVKDDQSAVALLLSSVTDLRNLIILLGHWLMHAYGLISITGFRDPLFHGVLLALVPAPAAFYILTAQFTDPMKIHND